MKAYGFRRVASCHELTAGECLRDGLIRLWMSFKGLHDVLRINRPYDFRLSCRRVGYEIQGFSAKPSAVIILISVLDIDTP